MSSLDWGVLNQFTEKKSFYLSKVTMVTNALRGIIKDSADGEDLSITALGSIHKFAPADHSVITLSLVQMNSLTF